MAAPGVTIHILSAVTGEGLDALMPYTDSGRTVVLLGSSDVGKSTLINRLLGSEAQATREVRASDDRGRHATTYRRLFLMAAGGVLIALALRVLDVIGGPGRQGSVESVAALAEVMREAQAARGGSFLRDLGRGGLVGRLLSDENVAAAAGRARQRRRCRT